MYDVATEGQTSEVAYFSLFPGSTEQVAKRAYVTGIGDQVCGVSAYRLVSIPARKNSNASDTVPALTALRRDNSYQCGFRVQGLRAVLLPLLIGVG